jgi:hypothetical protein
MSTPLKTLIDTPDLEAALGNDADGALHQSINSYLDTWKANVQQFLKTGLPRDEFDRLTRLSESIDTASKILNFFVKMKSFTPGQS